MGVKIIQHTLAMASSTIFHTTHVAINCQGNGKVTCKCLFYCRLAADTTTVSDQVCLNLNVALRSVTQAGMVLVFMFAASWRLTVVTFIIIPIILVICKLYGQYYRYRHASQAVCFCFVAFLLATDVLPDNMHASGFKTTHVASKCLLTHPVSFPGEQFVVHMVNM